MAAHPLKETDDHADRPNGEPLLLRVREVASLLSCSERTVWKLANEDDLLPKVTLSTRCVRFRRRDVEALIDDLCNH